MPILGDNLTFDFTTINPTTGQVQDADFLPTCRVYDGIIDVPILTPLPVKRSGETGLYRVNFTASAANGFVAGHSYNVDVTATVAAIQAKSRINQFVLISPASKLVPV